MKTNLSHGKYYTPIKKYIENEFRVINFKRDTTGNLICTFSYKCKNDEGNRTVRMNEELTEIQKGPRLEILFVV